MHNISEVSDKVSGKILIITSKVVLERLINSDNSSLKSVNGYMKSCCFILFLNYHIENVIQHTLFHMNFVIYYGFYNMIWYT